VLFYGSNLRTRSLDGVLDFYVLTDGPVESGIWPRVSYHEWRDGGHDLRAKVATMTLATFHAAAAGNLIDTTIWARFVQPSALIWQADDMAASEVRAAIAGAATTAARLAVALGPAQGTAADYWRALFRATYPSRVRMGRLCPPCQRRSAAACCAGGRPGGVLASCSMCGALCAPRPRSMAQPAMPRGKWNGIRA